MAKWRNGDEWIALREGSACWVCGPGRPPGEVIAETAATWITTRREVACPINYEIHGNTNPHLHLHVFPRYVGDPFEGGPIRPSELHVTQTDAEVARLATAVRAALARP